MTVIQLQAVIALFIMALYSASDSSAAIKGDINADNKIDLVESIYSLQIASGNTGKHFLSTDLDGNTFYEIHKDTPTNQTCIVELQFGPTSIAAKEWLYLNDDSWIIGCEEDYIPGDEASLPYALNNGVLEITITGEPDPFEIRLVERFDDNFLTASVDGTQTWYFTEGRVNSLVDPEIAFTQAILSANPWYIVEVFPDDPNNPNCNGKFQFDGNLSLTVLWDDSGNPGVETGVYFVQNGAVTTSHDQKVETENIVTYSDQEINTIKTVLNADGTNDGTGVKKRWYQDEADAVAFLTSNSATSCFPLPVPTVVSAGQVWMDRNLGASRVATSTADTNAYGDLYQWGRGTDGHEKRASSNTSTPSDSDTPSHGDFITVSESPYDWRSSQNDALWQGVDGVNNPCPSGFRLPIRAEWDIELATWTAEDKVDAAFDSVLKIPASGFRNTLGIVETLPSFHAYWTSTVSSSYAQNMSFTATWARTSNNSFRGIGYAVRCIKD